MSELRESRKPQERDQVIGDRIVDDVLENLRRNEAKRKSHNQHAKGGTFERHIANLFTDRYNEPFSKSEGSGARANTKRLDENALDVMTGDITTPRHFIFKIECKKGYNDYQLVDFFFDESERGGKSSKKPVRDWLQKASKESERVHKRPLFIWRQDNKPIIAAVPQDVFETISVGIEFPIKMYWEGFVFMNLIDFLRIPDEMVFVQKDCNGTTG